MEPVKGLLEQAAQAGWAMPVALLLAVLLGSAILLQLGKFRSARDNSKRNLGITTPPGGHGWPLIGETLEFLAAKRANAAVQFFTTRVAKYGEIFTTHIFFAPTVSLSAPDGNKFLFANENKLVQNCWPASVAKLLGKDSLSLKVGEDHRKIRRLIASFFNPEGLQKFVPIIDAITRDHIAKYWEGKESIRGVPTLKEFTFAVAAGLFVSLSDDDPRFWQLEEATEVFLGGILQVPIDLPGTAYRKGRLARDAMYAIVDTLIAERKQELKEGKANSKKDLLALMLTVPNEDGILMSDDAIKDNINLMLFAGHDTSSITMALVLKYLYLNPACLRKVIQEQQEIALEKSGAPLEWNDTRKMKFTWQVVQETLRLQPPVSGAFRMALQDFQYAGYTILKGWKLYWTVDRSHVNPAYFPDPEKFDPSRFAGSGPPPFVWVPFGGGPHTCLGNEFARTEMMVFLHHIVLSFDWKMVDPCEPISIDPMPIFKHSLQLQVWKKDS